MKYIITILLFLNTSFASATSLIDNIAVPENEKIISFTTWDTGDLNLLCVVREKPQVEYPNGLGEPRTQTLVFYRLEENTYKEIYNEPFLGYSLVSLFQDCVTEGRFHTIFIGRRYYSVFSYYFIDGKIKKVLETSSDCFPEFLHLDDKLAVRVTMFEFLPDSVEETIISYKWDNNDKIYIKDKKIKTMKKKE